MNALFPTPPAVIAIDKGIPLAPRSPIFQRKYPFKDMEVGDSCFIPGKNRQQIKISLKYASCDCRRFATRAVIENGVKGLRVWRTL